MSINLNTFDLNLLRTFDAVLREGSLTSAGAQLGLSQSAMSHALQRLRALCNDPLFVRTTKGMTPTAFAQTIAAPLAAALATISSALSTNISFDPATSTRRFKILTTDIAELIFLPQLMPLINRQAPGVSVDIAQVERTQYRDALETGVADIALGRLPELHRDFYQQHLFDEPFVCLMRKDHPVIGQRLGMQQFMDSWQISISEPAQVEAILKRALGAKAARRKIALHLPHHVVVPMILARSDLIAVLPKAAGEAFLDVLNLKALALPFKVPAARVHQFWHQRAHHDAGHKWLRNMIAELFMH